MRLALALVFAVLLTVPAGADVRLSSNDWPQELAATSDGSLWIADEWHDVMRLAPDGRLTRYRVDSPFDITAGPGGGVWFTGLDGVGRIDAGGALARIPDTGGLGIAVDADGAAWVTGDGGIGRLSAAGDGRSFEVPGPYWIRSIAVGSDGALWFTLDAFGAAHDAIGRMTPDGHYTKFRLPRRGAAPTTIAAGPDGALWFTEQKAHIIGRITTAGVITEFPLTEELNPYDITAADGVVWFSTESCLGRVTPAGEVTTWRVPGARLLRGLAPAPGGSFWLADNPEHTIRQFTPGGATGCAPPTKTRTVGTVQASLVFRLLDVFDDGDEFFGDARMRIARGGREVFAEVVPRSRQGQDNVVVGYTHGFRMRDLDGDGEPEVLLELDWNGAHCCTWTRVYRYDAARGTYRAMEHFWGNSSSTPHLRDLDADGRPEFVSTDDRFAYDFDGYAGSLRPVQIWSYRQGRFTDVTRKFPRAVRRDAATIWRLYLTYRKKGWARGVLPAWAADQYLLGRGADAERVLLQAARRGELSCAKPCYEDAKDAAGYLRAVDRMLRNYGYKT